MFTLIYLNGKFNRPDTLSQFLRSNAGESPFIQIDCITPFPGTKDELIRSVCEYLSKIDPEIQVTHNVAVDSRTESDPQGGLVNYLAMQIYVKEK